LIKSRRAGFLIGIEETFGTAVLSSVFELSRLFDENKTHFVAEVGRHWQRIMVNIWEIYGFASV